jgi:hypothetical protein
MKKSGLICLMGFFTFLLICFHILTKHWCPLVDSDTHNFFHMIGVVAWVVSEGICGIGLFIKDKV